MINVEIQEVTDQLEKSVICNSILHALPNWFGVEESIVDYSNKVKSMPFFAAYHNKKPIGFIAMHVHNKYTCEICVMGILSEYHRHGIGKKLIALCESYCIKNEHKFLTVKTLDESRSSRSYERTRLFYFSVGFYPLEVFPLLWDKDNPCLFLAKYIIRT